MKFKIAAFSGIILLAVVLLGSAVCPPTASALDVVVKISRIENTLNLIDELAGSDTPQAKAPATAQIRAMLQGTDWIDPDRQIVIGLELAGEQYISGILIPHIRPNANFQAAFNAKIGSDYYMISLPPGSPQVISENMEEALLKAGSSKSKTTIMAQVTVDRLLKKNREQIDSWLEKIETSKMQQTDNPMAPTPEDARAMISGMLDIASQLDTISFGIDLTPAKLAFVFSSQARAESEIAGLFTRTNTPVRLSTFKPDFQINFGSGPYNIAGFMKMMGNTFGPFYQKIGLDFSEIASMCEPFSGEMAGGLSYDKDKINFEAISVFKDGNQAVDFLENVYLPWMEKYSRNLAGLLEQQSGRKLADVFVQTTDTAVAGCKVVGVKSKFPVFPALPQTAGAPVPDCPVIVYDTRMTTVDNLLLMASNDRRLEKMIGLTRTFIETTSSGPLMTLDMDLGAYLSALGEMLPDLNIPMPGGKKTFSGLGKLAFTMNLENGRIDTVTSFKLDDIKSMITSFKEAMAAPPAGSKGRVPQTSMKTESAGRPDQLPEKPQYTEKDPEYWSDKGGLVAAYGNDKAAVGFYKKAIKLDPQRSDYYFNLSVSYCELGEYVKALTSIDRALAMDNENGAYYYTRGRIYLLSTDSTKALEDFIQSARLDHKDARDYLNNVAHVQWE
ncbi:MAG: tetratricopeptide repeat protein [Deltaproteobacteria bacterium]|nr:tetratricopeptide repeat protein [Deltaproteobacteria bacterium]